MGNPKKGTRIRWVRTATSVLACSTTLSLAGTLISPTARAQDHGSSASALVSALTDAQSRVNSLDLQLGTLRETVNRALVDLHDAQSRAEQARRGVDEARKRLEQSQSEVEAARRDLAEVTRSQYRSQGTPSPLSGASGLNGGDAQKDVLDRSLYLRQQVEEKQATLADVERARTEAANEESTLRETSRLAEQAASEATAAEQEARATLESSQRALDEQLRERSEAEAEVFTAEEKLHSARPAAQPAAPEEKATASQPSEGASADARAVDKPKEAEPAKAEPVNPELAESVRKEVAATAPEAPAPSDEVIANAVTTAKAAAEKTGEEKKDAPVDLAAAIAASSTLVESTQANHGSLDNPYSGSSSADTIAAFSNGLASVLKAVDGGASAAPGVEEVLPKVDSAETVTEKISGAVAPVANASAVETVIARATSAIGTPYVWGGGDASGPTSGMEGGMKGFDCSGLVLYAFAAAGVSLPHYTGYQYQRGTQVNPKDAKRGDLLFWGPEGSQHVAIYLGDGTMIEAPQSGQNVQISPVRWSGMADKAVRLL